MTGRRAGVLAAAGGLLLALVLSVLPAKAWFAQRDYRQGLERQAAAATEANRVLRERAEALDRDAEIERIARSSYHLVRPGEEAYVILPDNSPPEPPAPPAPVKTEKPGWVSRTWSKITSVF